MASVCHISARLCPIAVDVHYGPCHKGIMIVSSDYHVVSLGPDHDVVLKV